MMMDEKEEEEGGKPKGNRPGKKARHELKLAEIKSGDGMEKGREGEVQKKSGGANGARGCDRSNLGTAAPLDA